MRRLSPSQFARPAAGHGMRRETVSPASCGSGLMNPQEEAAVPFASLVFGDFQIERREDGSFWELGCGAMGVTYLALDKVLNRSVALKVIEVPPAVNARKRC